MQRRPRIWCGTVFLLKWREQRSMMLMRWTMTMTEWTSVKTAT